MSSVDPISFLMKVRPQLLEQYAERHGVKSRRKTKEETSEEYVDAVREILTKEPVKNQASFNDDIEDIDSMSTERGCEQLKMKVFEEDRPFDEKAYSELSNGKERALYFYLNYYDLFYETRDLYDLETKQGWRGRKTETIPLESVRDNIPDLEKALKKFYSKEARGSHLKVKQIPKDGRITYVAYIEDIPTNDLTFQGDQLESEQPRRPVFMAYFLYRPKDGIIEVKAEGGKARVKRLQDLFITHFLKADPRKFEKAVRYDFEKVKQLDELEFPTETKDNVESVTLKGLKLVHIEKTLWLSIDLAHDPNRTGVIPMQERLKKMDVDLKEYEVRSFKLRVVFKRLQGQTRQERVTVAVTHPDISDLKDREIDNTVRGLLKKWKLDFF
jgi:hypothetical protein